MIARLVSWCARHHWIVIVVRAGAAIGGDLARRGLARDVIPDLADPQIGSSPTGWGTRRPRSRRRWRSALTAALADVPGAKAVRGSTMTGMAYVDVVFASAAALRRRRAGRSRRRRARRGPRCRRTSASSWGPTGVDDRLGVRVRADRSGARSGRCSRCAVFRTRCCGRRSPQSRASRRSPRSGASCGRCASTLKPRELRERGLAFTDVVAALRRRAARRGRPEPAWREFACGSRGAARSPRGRARPLGDVALVRLAEDMQTGLADLAGVAGGRRHRHRRARRDIAALIDEVKRDRARVPQAASPADSGGSIPARPPTSTSSPPTTARTWRPACEQTLLRALAEEVGVVVVVILLFLLARAQRAGPARDAAARAAAHLRRMWMLRRARDHHEPGRDRRSRWGWPSTPTSSRSRPATVGSKARCRRRRAERAREAAGGGRSVRAGDPDLAGHRRAQLSCRCLAFTGETGRLLRPLAFTKTLVIAAAALVTLTVAPALRDRLLRGRVVPEFDNPLTRGLVRALPPVRPLCARPPGAHAGHGGAAPCSRACRSSPVWEASSCRASTRAISCSCPPRCPASRPSRPPRSSTGRTAPSRALPRGRRRCSARSAAPTPPPIPRPSRWPRPPSA